LFRYVRWRPVDRRRAITSAEKLTEQQVYPIPGYRFLSKALSRHQQFYRRHSQLCRQPSGERRGLGLVHALPAAGAVADVEQQPIKARRRFDCR
jgi:hypothetical protein